ncbi:hypothetical protein CYMTET_53683 [Cymbomonas tetramitiformis]|uniref:Mechanosensitive ion channel MscS domain-containing protein n=1 Tax=Cymbomonas tetramitiformis TaxID=36881 RepID=A0AAE0BGJ5_9CHLO|nr:hypothetical protein CYMTET_53683 [Cymbomonas tetramitiformis]
MMSTMYALGLANSVYVVSGFGGLAFGLASKDVVANFFGGAMLTITQPFSVQEEIELNGKKGYYVKKIGWYQTTLVNDETYPLYVPNHTFVTKTVRNYSRNTHRKLKIDIGIQHTDSSTIRAVVDGIQETLANNSNVDSTFDYLFEGRKWSGPIRVFCTGCTSEAIIISVQCYFQTNSSNTFNGYRQECILSILDVISQCGATLAKPAFDVSLTQDLSSSD